MGLLVLKIKRRDPVLKLKHVQYVNLTAVIPILPTMMMYIPPSIDLKRNLCQTDFTARVIRHSIRNSILIEGA